MLQTTQKTEVVVHSSHLNGSLQQRLQPSSTGIQNMLHFM